VTVVKAGSGRILFRSSIERRFLFYLLAASALIGPVVILGFAVARVWALARATAYILMAAAAVDFGATLLLAFALRYVEVTFDGGLVRVGSTVFKSSIPAVEILSAEAVTAGGRRPFRSREYIKLVTATGAYRVPCRNPQTLVQLIEYHRRGGG
jgi:predicted membrane channel-forming protein YqfA (hemolysin III family)